jgi:hypothetical protein
LFRCPSIEVRGFKEKERTDEDPLKFKSQQWMLHVEGKVLVEGI